MEQGDSANRMTPYDLATLASRINPERCVKDPDGALTAAVELLRHAKNVLWARGGGGQKRRAGGTRVGRTLRIKMRRLGKRH